MAEYGRLKQLAEGNCPVFYFYSAESYLVREQSNALCTMLAGEDTESTVLDDPAPSIEAIVMAAGTISFFGTRRLVRLPNLDPSAYSDKDIDELCDVLSSMENAVFVLSTVVPEERGKIYLAKRMQKLVDVCGKIGYAVCLQKPTTVQFQQMVTERAAKQGAVISDSVAKTMLERIGEDAYLLENETDKLCAVSGYGTVTPGIVAQAGTAQLDAKVFDLIDLLTVHNSTAACRKLQELLRLQTEPVMIAASLAGSYIDMYRVRLGQAQHKNFNVVFSDFGYKGKPFRFKYVMNSASHYSVPQLEKCLMILTELDHGLKSSPIDKEIQLETALCRLCAAGSRI